MPKLMTTKWHWYIDRELFRFVTIHAFDRWTDGQTLTAKVRSNRVRCALKTNHCTTLIVLKRSDYRLYKRTHHYYSWIVTTTVDIMTKQIKTRLTTEKWSGLQHMSITQKQTRSSYQSALSKCVNNGRWQAGLQLLGEEFHTLSDDGTFADLV